MAAVAAVQPRIPCSVCGKGTRRRCGVCKVPICGAACQRVSWKRGHKAVCAEPAAAAREAVVAPVCDFEEGVGMDAREPCPICLEKRPLAENSFLSCCSKVLCTACGWKYLAHESRAAPDREVRCPLCRGQIPWTDAGTVAAMERNAARGDLVATCQLGLYHARGKYGLAVDAARAAALFGDAARGGHLGACVQYGKCWEAGAGVGRADAGVALGWYRRAAAGGHVRAIYNLGCFHAEGLGGLKRDAAEAARLYRIAADRGDPNAQNNLGLLYHAGTTPGLPRDDAEAARLFAAAAESGDDLARRNLAVLRRRDPGKD